MIENKDNKREGITSTTDQEKCISFLKVSEKN